MRSCLPEAASLGCDLPEVVADASETAVVKSPGFAFKPSGTSPMPRTTRPGPAAQNQVAKS